MEKTIADVITRYLNDEYIPPRELSHTHQHFRAKDDHLYVLIKTAQGFRKTLRDFRLLKKTNRSPASAGADIREIRLRLMIDRLEREIIRILRQETGSKADLL